MNIAIILAGGTGTRMEQDIPKQFIHVYDKPIHLRIFRNIRLSTL